MSALLFALVLSPATPVLGPSWPMAVEGVGAEDPRSVASASPVRPVSGTRRAIAAPAAGWPAAQQDERSRPPPRPAGPPRTRVITVPEQGWPSAQPQPGTATPQIVGSSETPATRPVAPLVCPAGTQTNDRLPAYGATEYEQWCSRPDGVRHGPLVTWHANGRPSIAGQYRDGVEDGTWTHWHPTGERRSVHTYVDGKPHGVWRDWHPNGKLEQESHYVAGERHGRATRWYANGQVFVTTDYAHDAVPDGIHRFYDEKGGLLEEGPYVDGKRHGEWTVVHPDGHVLERQRWVRGERAK
jgi:hypothetical protein